MHRRAANFDGDQGVELADKPLGLRAIRFEVNTNSLNSWETEPTSETIVSKALTVVGVTTPDRSSTDRWGTHLEQRQDYQTSTLLL